MRRWPDVLETPSFPGFGLSPVDQTVRGDMEVGLARTRQVTFAENDTFEMSWIFSDEEMGAFRAWEASRPVSLAGDSDDLRGWAQARVTAALSGLIGPDECIPTRIAETATTGTHAISTELTGLVDQNVDVVLYATIKASGCDFAKVSMIDRNGVADHVVINLAAGTVVSTSGATATLLDRENGYWRVRLVANTGSGALTPVMRISCMADGVTDSYAGNTANGIRICEVMARQSTGADLFLRSGPDGKALGAGGGAWVTVPLAVGGGFAYVEARFKGRFKAQAGNGLEWTVSATMEARYA